MRPLVVDDLAPFDDWPAAVRASLTHLHRTVGLDVWMLTEVTGTEQVVLHAHPREAVPAGTSFPWEQTFCRAMVSGTGPRVATVTAAVPVYSQLLAGHPARIAAYVGVPLVTRSGELFGTLCGFSARAQPRTTARFLPTVEHTARLLSTLLPADSPGAPVSG
ncbi:GAF domain-containing protein [Modestobacter sp. SYSU DS0875]